jgi:hypothetical protein
VINDASYSSFYLAPPQATAGALSWPLPDADYLFAAPTAAAWAAQYIGVSPTAPFHDLAPAIFTDGAQAFKPASMSMIALHTLVCSIFAVVLATRCNRPTLDMDMQRNPSAVQPLASALLSALVAVPPSKDSFATGLLWSAAWVHLLADLRKAELACGREGVETARANLEGLRDWASNSRARRAVLHCVDIQAKAKESPVGREVPPHVYIFLFQACKEGLHLRLGRAKQC